MTYSQPWGTTEFIGCSPCYFNIIVADSEMPILQKLGSKRCRPARARQISMRYRGSMKRLMDMEDDGV